MATVTSTLKMFDAMTGPLKSVTNSMNLLISAMHEMQQATNQNINLDKTLKAAKQQIAHAETEIRRAIDEANAAQQRFNRSVQESQSGTTKLLQGIKGMALRLAAAYLSMQAIQQAIQATDTFVTTQARLGLIVDKGQTVDQLQQTIFAAAQRASADLNVMTDSVARLGLLAGDVFGSTNEMVAFAETLQKAFSISGASMVEQQAAMYQLTQAMAAGKLQGDEFRSIMENAPMVADAIARYMGVSKGALRELSSEGKITADIIKNAIFQAAEDINKKFAEMPLTFGGAFQQLKNHAFMAFEPVFKLVSEWLNSTQASAFFQSLSTGIYVAAQTSYFLLNTIILITNAVQEGWRIIEPILVVISASLLALLVHRLLPIIATLWAAIPPLLMQAKAWFMLNLPILLIGAAIGFVIYALYKWGDATAEVVGFVFGLFNALFGSILNLFIMFSNMAVSIAEFFANVWRDPVYAVKKLFYDLVIEVLQYLQNLARGVESIVNSIPGVQISISTGLTNLLSRVEAARAGLTSEKDVVRLPRLDQINIGDMFKSGQAFGRSIGQFAAKGVQGVAKTISNAFKMPGLDSLQKTAGLGKGLEGLAKLPEGIEKVGKVGSVGKIEDTVDISSEDLKLMRELAEMKSIQNFVTLTPTVNVTTGDIRNDADIDTIIRRIEETLEREIAIAAQGVYG